MKKLVLLLLMGVIVSLQAASAVKQNGSTPLVLKDCEIKNLKDKAKCGTLEVYEDRAARKGRKINLNIVVLREISGKRNCSRVQPGQPQQGQREQ